MKVTIRSFREAESDIRFVRDIVFGQEQNVAREVDWDGKDSQSIQVVATDDDNNPVGTGRMQPDGKIGRLAVLDSWRGQGIGQKMLRVLVETAEKKGFQEVFLHAQVHAASFYEKCGFHKNGEEFLEAGIPHVKMTRNMSKI
ncbi:MAG: GNAT family N-acetyltransferase [Opitutae bacterium]|nr:GNAT family N-acetyltransferase [Opitutae bacterium]